MPWYVLRGLHCIKRGDIALMITTKPEKYTDDDDVIYSSMCLLFSLSIFYSPTYFYVLSHGKVGVTHATVYRAYHVHVGRRTDG